MYVRNRKLEECLERVTRRRGRDSSEEQKENEENETRNKEMRVRWFCELQPLPPAPCPPPGGQPFPPTDPPTHYSPQPASKQAVRRQKPKVKHAFLVFFFALL